MRYSAGIPIATYARRTAPDTWAMPPVIIVRISERVIVGM